jgi:hypothetical protein
MRKVFVILLTGLFILVSGCGRREDASKRVPEQSPPVTKQRLPITTFDFSDVSPKDALDRATSIACQWNSKAVLQAVLANKWNLFGDPGNRRVTGMEVPEWQFIFAAGDKIGTFLVTRDAVKLLREEEKPRSQPSNSPIASPPISDWKVDVSDALNTAWQSGVIVAEGPWLWMRNVAGVPEPVWTILTPTTGFFVSAKTGRIISKDSVD